MFALKNVEFVYKQYTKITQYNKKNLMSKHKMFFWETALPICEIGNVYIFPFCMKLLKKILEMNANFLFQKRMLFFFLPSFRISSRNDFFFL